MNYYSWKLWTVIFFWNSRDWGQEEKGTTQDEIAGWHHGLNGCESEWTPGGGDGQGGLACCDSWGRKESDTTERMSWTELNWTKSKQSYHILLCFNLTSSSKRYIKGKKHGEDKTFSNRKTKQRNNYISLENLRIGLFHVEWIFTIMFHRNEDSSITIQHL